MISVDLRLNWSAFSLPSVIFVKSFSKNNSKCSHGREAMDGSQGLSGLLLVVLDLTERCGFVNGLTTIATLSFRAVKELNHE